jgi:hypothetical protein
VTIKKIAFSARRGAKGRHSFDRGGTRKSPAESLKRFSATKIKRKF